MIPDDDEAVLVEDGGAALAELIAHLLVAEILLPDWLAVHVVHEHALRLEPRVHALPIGDRRARRICAVVLMARFMRQLFACGPFPRDLAGAAIDGEDDESMAVARLDAAPRRMRGRTGEPNRHG